MVPSSFPLFFPLSSVVASRCQLIISSSFLVLDFKPWLVVFHSWFLCSHFFLLTSLVKETQINVDKTSLNQALNVSFLSALNNHNKKTFVKGDILVSSSGISLVENVDYVVDYEKGNLRVINQSLLAGDQQLNISFKN